MAHPEVSAENHFTIPQIENFVSYSHIYKREIVATNYDKNFIRAFSEVRFEKLIPQILSEHCKKEWDQLKVFEGGVGTGLFTIPLFKYILEQDDRSFLMGNDNSPAMLEVLFNKPEFQTIKSLCGDRLTIRYGDLETEEDYPDKDFNVMVFAGVLHCLVDEHSFLKQIDRILENEGILILVFKTDSFTRLQCGEPVSYSSIDTHYGNFWQYYHHLRKSKHVPIDAHCRFIYDVYHVNKLIQIYFNNRYAFQKIYEFPWFSTTTLEQMVCSIKHGLTFATGQGVPPEMLAKFGKEMEDWILRNNLKDKEVDVDHKMEVAVWKKTT